MSRPLSNAKIGEVAVAMAFAALDAGAEQDAILAAWPSLSAMMPLALGLATNAVAARGPMTPEMRETIREIMEAQKDQDNGEHQ